jgi:hypothetical protein
MPMKSPADIAANAVARSVIAASAPTETKAEFTADEIHRLRHMADYLEARPKKQIAGWNKQYRVRADLEPHMRDLLVRFLRSAAVGLVTEESMANPKTFGSDYERGYMAALDDVDKKIACATN